MYLFVHPGFHSDGHTSQSIRTLFLLLVTTTDKLLNVVAINTVCYYW
jgi:hypothetical protein